MNVLHLKIDFQSYWHAGTGRGSGHHLDALVVVDRHGLPFLPGKTLRGILRDAFYRLENWGSCPEKIGKGSTELFFGTSVLEVEDEQTVIREETEPGCIHVSDAVLPEGVVSWLAGEDGTRYLPFLFREHFSTAMNENGVARPKSLRGMQVTVPLQLKASISVLDEKRAPGQWKEIVAAALPLLRCAGAYRSRGFGRCSITVEEVGNA